MSEGGVGEEEGRLLRSLRRWRRAPLTVLESLLELRPSSQARSAGLAASACTTAVTKQWLPELASPLRAGRRRAAGGP